MFRLRIKPSRVGDVVGTTDEHQLKVDPSLLPSPTSLSLNSLPASYRTGESSLKDVRATAAAASDPGFGDLSADQLDAMLREQELLHSALSKQLETQTLKKTPPVAIQPEPALAQPAHKPAPFTQPESSNGDAADEESQHVATSLTAKTKDACSASSVPKRRGSKPQKEKFNKATAPLENDSQGAWERVAESKPPRSGQGKRNKSRAKGTRSGEGNLPQEFLPTPTTKAATKTAVSVPPALAHSDFDSRLCRIKRGDLHDIVRKSNRALIRTVLATVNREQPNAKLSDATIDDLVNRFSNWDELVFSSDKLCTDGL